MKRKNLPTEVLDQIFSRLNVGSPYTETVEMKTVTQCILVCKQWKIPAQRVYFSKITLKKEEKVDSLIQTLKKSKSSPRIFTHTLTYKLYDQSQKKRSDNLMRMKRRLDTRKI